MKVNTTNPSSIGITNVNASILNFGGGPFPFIQGKVIPELGDGIEVTSVFVSTIIRQNGVFYKGGTGGDAGTWVEGNYINWSAQAPTGWLEFGEGLTLHWYVQVNYLVNGQARANAWDLGGISLAPPAVPSLSVSANVNPEPSKPIHRVNVSASVVPNGATILQKKIWINGTQVPDDDGNPFTASVAYNDGTPPISYYVVAEVQYQTTVYGVTVTGWVNASAQVMYLGEGLEQ